ncbi:MAG: hypothetical protein HRU20_23470 [Pseudomonadales bacterium]|nr:hypothetical protein [Pseudomonadales bacterium]
MIRLYILLFSILISSCSSIDSPEIIAEFITPVYMVDSWNDKLNITVNVPPECGESPKSLSVFGGGKGFKKSRGNDAEYDLAVFAHEDRRDLAVTFLQDSDGVCSIDNIRLIRY